MSSTRSYHDEGPSPSRPAEIIQLLCEAMRFALAENAAREEKEEKKKEREKRGEKKKETARVDYRVGGGAGGRKMRIA